MELIVVGVLALIGYAIYKGETSKSPIEKAKDQLSAAQEAFNQNPTADNRKWLNQAKTRLDIARNGVCLDSVPTTRANTLRDNAEKEANCPNSATNQKDRADIERQSKVDADRAQQSQTEKDARRVDVSGNEELRKRGVRYRTDESGRTIPQANPCACPCPPDCEHSAYGGSGQTENAGTQEPTCTDVTNLIMG